MPVKKVKKVILLGSGALKIGEAGEFDYSGSQALKALKEEGIFTVLVNPNIATVQTSREMADKIYFLPVNADFVSKIAQKEKPDGILISFGGQTALNCGLSLWRRKLLEKCGLKVLGTPIESVENTENRELFKEGLESIGVKAPKSAAADSIGKAMSVGSKLGYPVILRSGYSLGGEGSNIAFNGRDIEKMSKIALLHSPQVLIEEYLDGWKEIEYEIVRDKEDNIISVCNMENMDPMGIHTGESMVVAPSQTLSNEEYYFLREIAFKVIRHFKIIGECNIQFALNPKANNLDYRVIEVNARLSRSSALASKATGYPLAFVAAKLALGYTLPELQNKVTKSTSAFFEPALDYIVVKIPRWDLKKFTKSLFEIGSSMQSVGEVMAIGRNFEETFQKASRTVRTDKKGIVNSLENLKRKYPEIDFTNNIPKILSLIKTPNPYRSLAIAEALKRGISPEKICQLSKIDKWFIYKIKNIVDLISEIEKSKDLSRELFKKAKSFGFSDDQLAFLRKTSEEKIRKERERAEILPKTNQVDTLAAEYPAKTNYLYLTYKDEPGLGKEIGKEIKEKKKKIIILGSGPFRIGSSVEFDFCSVISSKVLRNLGYETIIINNNPETVSTDFDISDKLYFEEISLEKIKSIYDQEKAAGVIVSMGGQEPNNLALELKKAGVKILGTDPKYINTAEDRHIFSRLLEELKISQPEWQELSKVKDIKTFAQKHGYPLLIRPSYVLSGTAMNVALNEKDLENYLTQAVYISKDHPVVVSKFITGAKEIEVDGVAQQGSLKAVIISEHIENAGVHSGDATITLPPQTLYVETINQIKRVTGKIAKALSITGPFNIQLLAKENEIKVIECNLRASRTFPFVSKAANINLVEIAILAMLGQKIPDYKIPLDLDYTAIKAPQFSFFRIKGADPILRVEMSSTGEVGCFGDNIYEAYLKSIISTGFEIPEKTILISLGGDKNKIRFLEEARILFKLGYKIYGSEHTAEFFLKNGVKTEKLYKIHEKKEPNIKTFLESKKIDLAINITDQFFKKEIEDDYLIRREAIDSNVPLLTDLKGAKLFVRALEKLKKKEIKLQIKSLDEYLK